MQFFIFGLLAPIDDNHFPRGVEEDQFGICDLSLLRPLNAHLCLLVIIFAGQILPPSLKLPRPQLDRFLCSKQAVPTLITSCWAGLTLVAAQLCLTTWRFVPGYLSHICLLSFAESWLSLPVWHTLYLLADGVTKSNLLETSHGGRMGSFMAITQLGRCWGWQMCWVEELPDEEAGRHYPVDFGWGLIPLSGNPWLLSDGALSVSLSQIYLSGYY